MEDILIPLGAFTMVVLIVALNVWAGASRRKQVMETVRDAIRSGQNLDADTVRALGAEGPKKEGGDLKAGLILIAVAAALVVFGYAVGSADVSDTPEVVAIFSAIAAFPGFIGVVLVLFGLANAAKRKNDDAA
ncbi:MAG: DUF6249 domain-containing protein [Oceanicaulis sp.]